MGYNYPSSNINCGFFCFCNSFCKHRYGIMFVYVSTFLTLFLVLKNISKIPVETISVILI